MMRIITHYDMGDSNRRRILRKERLAQNLCMYCGKKPFLTNKKGCTDCLNKCSKVTCRYAKSNRGKIKEYHSKIRQEVIQKYGNKCACCGESNWQFLAIDHINQNGGEERKELYGSQSGNSNSWFLKLRREPIRNDLRVLCHNCNMAVFQFGVCPHEQRQENNQTAIS